MRTLIFFYFSAIHYYTINVSRILESDIKKIKRKKIGNDDPKQIFTDAKSQEKPSLI